jgi:hypothetical protein
MTLAGLLAAVQAVFVSVIISVHLPHPTSPTSLA